MILHIRFDITSQMKKSILFCLLITLLIVGCTEKESEFNKVLKDWPEPKLLEGEQILENEYSHLYTEQVDTLLLAVTNRDTLFHIYDKKLNHLASIGKKGRGPAEFPMPPVIEDFYQQNDTTKALIYNQFRREFVTIKLPASVENNELIIESNTKLPEKLWGLRNIFYLGSEAGYIGMYEDRNQKRIDERRGGFIASPELGEVNIFSLKNLSVEPFEMTPEINANGRTPGISPNRDKFATTLALSFG